MTKEKQIEEIIMLFINIPKCKFPEGFAYRPYVLAEALYDAGYRKQSVGEWTFHKDGSATCNKCRTTQKNVWDIDNYQTYCGHRGAKMKGSK